MSNLDFPHVITSSSQGANSMDQGITNFQRNVITWNIHTFGNLFHKKSMLIKHLNYLQNSIHYLKSFFLQNLERTLLAKYNSFFVMNKIFGIIINCLNDGDANTKFFHLFTI